MNKQIKIIQQIESLLEELKKETGVTSSSVSSSKKIIPEGGYSGLTGDIFDLVKIGFFDNKKTLSEIQRKLKEEGVNKPTTALMRPVLFLIRKKILGRNKPDKGQYEYFKRSN